MKTDLQPPPQHILFQHASGMLNDGSLEFYNTIEESCNNKVTICRMSFYSVLQWQINMTSLLLPITILATEPGSNVYGNKNMNQYCMWTRQ